MWVEQCFPTFAGASAWTLENRRDTWSSSCSSRRQRVFSCYCSDYGCRCARERRDASVSSISPVVLSRTHRDCDDRFEGYELEDRFFVNPGSASGAFMTSSTFSAQSSDSSEGTNPPNPTPSFVLLDIQGFVIVTYVYQLINDEVKVEKVSPDLLLSIFD